MSHGRQSGGRGLCALAALLLAVVVGAGCGTKGPPGSIRTHTVKKGETAWRISQKYDSTVAAIARENGLRDPTKLAIGQKLKVPVGVKGRSSHARARVGAKPKSSSSNGSGRWMARDRRGRSPEVRFGWPVRGRLASRYGLRAGAHHDGIDIAGKKGTKIRAAEAGRVVHSDDSLAGYGHMVILKHAGVYSTVYAHNRRNLVKVGQFVQRGEVIAELGDSGRTTAPHLHFEVRRDGRPADPLDFLR